MKTTKGNKLEALLILGALMFCIWAVVPPLAKGALDAIYDQRTSVPHQKFRQVIYEFAFGRDRRLKKKEQVLRYEAERLERGKL